MKDKIAVIVVMAAALGFLSQARVFANDEGGAMAFRFDPATMSSRALEYKNIVAGQKFFRSNCKSCHNRGNDKSAQFLDTDSRTMRGWNAVFLKKNVRCAKDGAWARLSSEDLTYVNDYLYSKAYDTWDANTARSCG